MVVEFTVDVDGKATDIKVVDPKGSGFDEAAIEAIKKWHFTPAKKDGVSVPMRVRQPIRYRSEPEVIFELIEGMKFANGAKVHSIAKSDIEALRDLPILIGEEEDQIDGVTLINDKDDKIHVRTCREYEAAREQGYFGGPGTPSITKSILFGRQCDLLKALQTATIPHKSFISSPRVGAANLELLPYSLFPFGFGEEPESRELDVTYQSKVKEGVLIVENVSENLLRIEVPKDMGQELVEMVRADFNGDGTEDILFFEWNYATHGTFGTGGICILTRISMDGKFEEVFSHE